MGFFTLTNPNCFAGIMLEPLSSDLPQLFLWYRYSAPGDMPASLLTFWMRTSSSPYCRTAFIAAKIIQGLILSRNPFNQNLLKQRLILRRKPGINQTLGIHIKIDTQSIRHKFPAYGGKNHNMKLLTKQISGAVPFMPILKQKMIC